MKIHKTVKLPRPKGTRSTSRVVLAVSMHPRELAALEKRAAQLSMSLTSYVGALLASDAADVAEAMNDARVHAKVQAAIAPFGRKALAAMDEL